MISDKQLMKFCIVVSVIGIAALFFIVESIEPKTVEISGLNKQMIGQFVKINGKASNVYNNEGTLFLTLNNPDDGSIIKIVMFKNNLEIKEGNFIEVTGKLELYKNELEVIASSITSV